MTTSEPLHLFGGAGVELEYMIVDADTLDVKPLTDEVLKAVNGFYSENYNKPGVCWSNELALHVIELKTGEPTPSLADFISLFQQDVGQINTILRNFNARLMPSGVHPWMDPFRETRLWPHHHSAIYEAYNKIFDCRGHGWSNLQSAHLNLPFAGDEEFGRLHAAIRVLLPILPALAASTPIVDGRRQDFLDYRMEVYRTNSSKIPSLTGEVIPEPVFTRADYDTRIFRRIYHDTKPHDPDTILQHEWLNARGAIARFDRSAIEIRILDVQECPLADLAVASLIINTLKALVDGLWSDPAQLQQWRTAALADILFKTVKTAEKNMISNGDYLNIFGLQKREEMTAGDLWCHILQEIKSRYPLPEVFLEPLQIITQQGTLASRIVRQLNNDLSRPALNRVYGRLCECLAHGVMFTDELIVSSPEKLRDKTKSAHIYHDGKTFTMTRQRTPTLILSCEHATNHLPDQYRRLLIEALDQLNTHQGYDPGALDFARLLAARLSSAPLFAGSVSRLLVDLNRSRANHRSPPIPPRKDLPLVVKQEILTRYYLPYRRQVEEAIADNLRQEKTVLHLSIHSFTPVLDGVQRTADVGFLYDPSRAQEKEFCGKWRAALAARNERWRLRRNYPYLGTSDGFVTALRKKFPAQRYLGIELEINQIYPLARKADWLRLQHQLLESFVEVLQMQNKSV